MAPQQILKYLAVAAGLLASVSIAHPMSLVEVWETVTVVETVVVTATDTVVLGEPSTTLPSACYVNAVSTSTLNPASASSVPSAISCELSRPSSAPTSTSLQLPATTTTQPSPPDPSSQTYASAPSPLGLAASYPSAEPVAKKPETTSSPGRKPCTEQHPCIGDMTHWGGGLGSCGLVVNTRNESVVALPAGLMGVQSNDNPFCGLTVTVTHGEHSHKATVGDKCMGCNGHSIDATELLFLTVAPNGDGRVHNVTWWRLEKLKSNEEKRHGLVTLIYCDRHIYRIISYLSTANRIVETTAKTD
ncbi:hypothetical protein PAAG_07685 [Paracoccidioides lutzii Pb01]|uniref:Riboflavin aldehyde-forming enzyme n=1 Tax=Paracoccidioides lutzii (strain ATCC MYA-826 / Pb01) TaxID=502779 RepID=C1HAN1_PARBA|nr:hypothetical protein PAAG_07685 [Paracoccidioides lutzii Pb01]EEH37404.2 hypothetical protein PAAG_07685 [Paracoccidioides lutzii Pb01]